MPLTLYLGIPPMAHMESMAEVTITKPTMVNCTTGMLSIIVEVYVQQDGMEDFLGGVSVAGGKLKTIDGWNSPNLGATNESGYTGLLGGYRFTDGTYLFNLQLGQWWTSTNSNTTTAHTSRLFYQNAAVLKSTYDKKIGSSVRCLKD
jgi:uncharacterized protein (TIGR02145 family)